MAPCPPSRRRQDACRVANRNSWPWDQDLSLFNISLEIEIHQPLTHSQGDGCEDEEMTSGVDPRSEPPTCGPGGWWEVVHLPIKTQGAYYPNEWVGGTQLMLTFPEA